jgi:hypothetical protein
MDQEKLANLLRRKYQAFQLHSAKAKEALTDLQEIAEAMDLKANDVNEMLGVKFLSDVEQPEQV